MEKKYYKHDIWEENNKKWIQSDEESFNKEVIEHRNLYKIKYRFGKGKTTYQFENKENPVYNWKIEVKR